MKIFQNLGGTKASFESIDVPRSSITKKEITFHDLGRKSGHIDSRVRLSGNIERIVNKFRIEIKPLYEKINSSHYMLRNGCSRTIKSFSSTLRRKACVSVAVWWSPVMYSLVFQE